MPIYIVGCYTRIETARMKELMSYGNILRVPKVKDLENEFLGTNPWASIIYNNFFLTLLAMNIAGNIAINPLLN